MKQYFSDHFHGLLFMAVIALIIALNVVLFKFNPIGLRMDLDKMEKRLFTLERVNEKSK